MDRSFSVTRRRPSATWRALAHVLHYSFSVVNDVVQRVVVPVSSSGLSKNSDVHERDLESCLHHHRRESHRRDVKLHDESASTSIRS